MLAGVKQGWCPRYVTYTFSQLIIGIDIIIAVPHYQPILMGPRHYEEMS
jgi:hypothetical protein